jgi:hypothetical protein
VVARMRYVAQTGAEDMIGSHGIANDPGRSCERRPSPPQPVSTLQMCQLISMSSCTIEMGFALRRAVKSSPRWKTLREPRIRFLVGRIGAEKGEGNIAPRKKPRRHAG